MYACYIQTEIAACFSSYCVMSVYFECVAYDAMNVGLFYFLAGRIVISNSILP